MKGQKSGRVISRHSSGRRFAPEAMNTAPAAPAPKGIAGHAKLKSAGPVGGASGPGTTGPSMGGGPRGFHAPMDAPACKGKRGGPSRAGDRYTQGGTSSPSHGRGPTGLGRSGTNYPGRGK